MKDLVDQDSLELARLRQEFGIEQHHPSRDVRGSQMRAQRPPQFHADRTAGQRR
jgi:hypothetical protein